MMSFDKRTALNVKMSFGCCFIVAFTFYKIM